MANIVFNIAKGRVAHYASLPATDDALVLVPLLAAGLEADAVLRDYDTLAAVLAGTNDEQTDMGRVTLTGVTVSVDDTGDRVIADANDVTWTAASGSAVGALLVCYDPDTTTGTDADLIPLTKHDFTVIPNGGDIIALVDALGFVRAE